MITSENVVFEEQFKNFSISPKSYVPLLRYSMLYIFNQSIYFKNCDVIMSISTQGRVHYQAYILNHLSLMKHSQLIDTAIGNNFRKYFA